MKEKVLILVGADGGLGRGMLPYFLKQDYHAIYVSSKKDFPLPDDSRIRSIITGSLDNQETVTELFSKVEVGSDALLFLFSTIGGFISGTPASETPKSTWESMLSKNLLSAAVLLSAFTRKAKQGGGICFTSAMSAFRNEEERAAYAASKAALNQLVISSAPELRHHNIGVYAVAPFLINTPANLEWMDPAIQQQAVTPWEVAVTAQHLFEQYHVLSGNIIRIEHRFNTQSDL